MKKLFISLVFLVTLVDVMIWQMRHRKPKMLQAVRVENSPKDLETRSISAQTLAQPVQSYAHLPQAWATGPSGDGWIQYMNNLKSCTPFVLNYRFLEWERGTRRRIIQGKNGDKCVVIDVLPSDRKVTCELGKELVQSLTSEERYRDAEEGPLSQDAEDLNALGASHCGRPSVVF